MTEQQVRRMLESDEGSKTTVYLDPVGLKTVGIGHNLVADKALHILHREMHVGEKITPEQITSLYEYDMAKVRNNLVEKIPGYATLQDKYKIILQNMCFNLGLGGVLKFVNMLKAMRNDDDVGVINSILHSQYAKQVPQRAKRMISIVNNQTPEEYK